MSHPIIFVAGIGPGSAGDVTPAVLEAIRQSDVIIGYKYYFMYGAWDHKYICLILIGKILKCIGIKHG